MKKYRQRTYYSEADKTMMWDRWSKGESLHSIARLFDRHHPSIRRILAHTGGIRTPTRRRAPLALSRAEREEISGGVVAGHSIRSIAVSLGRAPTTVSREIQHNGGRRRYRHHFPKPPSGDPGNISRSLGMSPDQRCSFNLGYTCKGSLLSPGC
jgi:hypothetical protein